jgi:hypothetical protein
LLRQSKKILYSARIKKNRLFQWLIRNEIACADGKELLSTNLVASANHWVAFGYDDDDVNIALGR